jgi:hypothetical protein
MTRRWFWAAAVSALLLAGCATPRGPAVEPEPEPEPVRSFGDVRDSVYRATDRATPPPPGYGLYTVLLSRSANRNTVKVLAELFNTTVAADEAALPPGKLNLITIPTKNHVDAATALFAAREQAEATAATVMARHYDYGQAALLLSGVCRPERGPAIMATCGSPMPNGPLLVTSPRPFDGRVEPGQQLLVVNLSQASPAAVAELLAAYRRQVSSASRSRKSLRSTWRLAVLTGILDAAQLLPGISKAYAAGR